MKRKPNLMISYDNRVHPIHISPEKPFQRMERKTQWTRRANKAWEGERVPKLCSRDSVSANKSKEVHSIYYKTNDGKTNPRKRTAKETLLKNMKLKTLPDVLVRNSENLKTFSCCPWTKRMDHEEFDSLEVKPN